MSSSPSAVVFLSSVLRGLRSDRRSRGFSLIELLVVVVIVGVLASITIGVSAGASRRAAMSRARTELATLNAALEEYRRVFRRYPAQATSNGLFRALVGPTNPMGTPVDRRAFVTLQGLATATGDHSLAGNAFVDPWDQPYRYAPIAGDHRSGFVLYSIGEDGLDAPPTTDGVIDTDAPANFDNIYAGR